MTAEPRMEELLASIRKAIQDDIGDVPGSTSSRTSESPFRGSMRALHARVSEEAASAAEEIQQLREKIHRTRATETLAKDYGPRTASFNPPQSAPSEAPRRSWRDLEPAPPLRPTVVEHDYAPAPIRQEHRVPREVLHVAEAVQPPAESWHDEQRTSLPPPVRERHHQVESAMMSGETAEAVQLAFGRLSESLLSRAGGGRSIEEITRELLRGMLKQWLDENLPQLVEQMVREEIERVARTGR